MIRVKHAENFERDMWASAASFPTVQAASGAW